MSRTSIRCSKPSMAKRCSRCSAPLGILSSCAAKPVSSGYTLVAATRYWKVAMAEWWQGVWSCHPRCRILRNKQQLCKRLRR